MLIGITILVLGIGWGKSWRFDRSTSMLLVRFPTVAGLETGDPVYIRGIKRGTVDKIDEAPDGRITVTVQLFEPQPIHKDATAAIAMLELMGGKKIEIMPGRDGAFDPARDTLYGSATGDLSSMVSFANSLTGTVQNLAFRVDTVLSSVNSLFDNGTLKKKTTDALDNATAMMSDIREVLHKNSSKITETLGDLDALTKQGSSALAEATPKATGLLDSIKDFISHTRITMSRADSALADLTQILEDAKHNGTVLYKLTSDKDFSRRIDSTVNTLNSLLRETKENGLDLNLHLFR